MMEANIIGVSDLIFADKRLQEEQTSYISRFSLDQLNILFSSGCLCNFELTGVGLMARKRATSIRSGPQSGADELPFLFAAGIITQENVRVLLIDEPEKHLRRYNWTRLIETALKQDDVPVIISSHDMTLIERLIWREAILYRGFDYHISPPDRRCRSTMSKHFEPGVIPEELRLDILGSRSRILYVEGTETSRDLLPLYAPVQYRGWKVISQRRLKRCNRSSAWNLSGRRAALASGCRSS